MDGSSVVGCVLGVQPWNYSYSAQPPRAGSRTNRSDLLSLLCASSSGSCRSGGGEEDETCKEAVAVFLRRAKALFYATLVKNKLKQPVHRRDPWPSAHRQFMSGIAELKAEMKMSASDGVDGEDLWNILVEEWWRWWFMSISDKTTTAITTCCQHPPSCCPCWNAISSSSSPSSPALHMGGLSKHRHSFNCFFLFGLLHAPHLTRFRSSFPPSAFLSSAATANESTLFVPDPSLRHQRYHLRSFHRGEHVLLIDIDNCAKILNFVKDRVPSNVCVIGFCGPHYYTVAPTSFHRLLRRGLMHVIYTNTDGKDYDEWMASSSSSSESSAIEEENIGDAFLISFYNSGCEKKWKNAADYMLSMYAGVLHRLLPTYVPFTIVSHDDGMEYVVDALWTRGREAERMSAKDFINRSLMVVALADAKEHNLQSSLPFFEVEESRGEERKRDDTKDEEKGDTRTINQDDSEEDEEEEGDDGDVEWSPRELLRNKDGERHSFLTPTLGASSPSPTLISPSSSFTEIAPIHQLNNSSSPHELSACASVASSSLSCSSPLLPYNNPLAIVEREQSGDSLRVIIAPPSSSSRAISSPLKFQVHEEFSFGDDKEELLQRIERIEEDDPQDLNMRQNGIWNGESCQRNVYEVKMLGRLIELAANEEKQKNEEQTTKLFPRDMTSLVIKGHRAGTIGIGLLVDHMLSRGGMPYLRHVDMRTHRMGNKGAAHMARLLYHQQSGCPALTQLDLRGNEIGDVGAIAIASAMLRNTRLTLLDLRWNRIGTRGAKSLSYMLQQNKTLTVLNLRKNRLGMEGVFALANALLSNRCVCHLDLRSNVSLPSVSHIGESGTEAMKSLATMLKLNSSITTLDLSSTNADLEGAISMAEALSLPSCELTLLHADFNQLGGPYLRQSGGGKGTGLPLSESSESSRDDLTIPPSSQEIARNKQMQQQNAGLNALFHSLTMNQTLILLTLANNRVDDDAACILARALCQNQTLTHIDLQKNAITNKGAAALAESLRHNQVLTDLVLKLNSIADAGAYALGEALHHNISLQTLDLESNKITSKGGIALSAGLKVHPSLAFLNINNNLIGDDGLSAICDAIADNPHSAIFRLDISGVDARSKGFAALERMVKKCPSIFRMDLSRNFIGIPKPLPTITPSPTTITTKAKILLSPPSNEKEDTEYNDEEQEGKEQDKQVSLPPQQTRARRTRRKSALKESEVAKANAFASNTFITQWLHGLVSVEAETKEAEEETEVKESEIITREEWERREGAFALDRVCSLLEGRHGTERLVWLSLSSCKLDDDGMRHLAAGLHCNNSLAWLDLNDNNIGAVGAASLVAALSHNPEEKMLTSLSLRYNHLADEGTAHLANLLQQNQTITLLNLEYNKIQEEGAISLGQSLASNKVLSILWLQGNEIGDNGLAALGDGLCQNETMLQIGLDRNAFSTEAASKFFDAIASHKDIASMLLRGSEKDWQLLQLSL
ncbi:Leucine-rich repeat-containing protein 74A [Balamuthia mandrillaris]